MKRIAQVIAAMGFIIVIFLTGITLAQSISEQRISKLSQRVSKNEVRIELTQKDLDGVKDVLLRLFFLVGGGFLGTGGLVLYTGKKKC